MATRQEIAFEDKVRNLMYDLAHDRFYCRDLGVNYENLGEEGMRKIRNYVTTILEKSLTTRVR